MLCWLNGNKSGFITDRNSLKKAASPNVKSQTLAGISSWGKKNLESKKRTLQTRLASKFGVVSPSEWKLRAQPPPQQAPLPRRAWKAGSLVAKLTSASPVATALPGGVGFGFGRGRRPGGGGARRGGEGGGRPGRGQGGRGGEKGGGRGRGASESSKLPKKQVNAAAGTREPLAQVGMWG